MRCPYCSHFDSKVIDSRDAHEGIRRRRECVLCGLRFTTYERIQAAALLVIKHDGRSELYNRDKLTSSIRIACAKRPLPVGAIDKVVEDIEEELQKLGRAEIPTTRIGEMVIHRLKGLDRVAYIRFASVYRDFQDVESFRREAEALQAGQGVDSERTYVDINRGTETGRRVRRAKLKPQPLPMNLPEGKV